MQLMKIVAGTVHTFCIWHFSNIQYLPENNPIWSFTAITISVMFVMHCSMIFGHREHSLHSDKLSTHPNPHSMSANTDKTNWNLHVKLILIAIPYVCCISQSNKVRSYWRAPSMERACRETAWNPNFSVVRSIGRSHKCEQQGCANVCR